MQALPGGEPGGAGGAARVLRQAQPGPGEWGGAAVRQVQEKQVQERGTCSLCLQESR